MTPERHQQILDLFAAAVAQPSAERDAFLAAKCAHDPDLRREVESLLSHHDPQTILEPLPSSHDIRPSLPHHLIPADRHRGSRRVAFDRGRIVLAATILTTAVLAVVLATWQYFGVRHTVRQTMAAQLKATLASNVAAVEYWFELIKKETEEWSAHPQVVAMFEDAARDRPEGESAKGAGRRLETVKSLRVLLAAEVGRADVYEIVGLNPQGALLFSSDGGPIDDQSRLTARGIRLFGVVLLGEGTVATHPLLVGPLATAEEVTAPDLPSILVGAPVRNAGGVVLGALVFRLESGQQFTQLLDLACEGDWTDVFAFDATGRLLSASRYEGQLSELGLIPRQPDATSVFTVELRDPGVKLASRSTEMGPRKGLPLTRMAAAAVTGADGVDTDGYRDVRGVWVVGAWDWLEEYGFGVALEIEYNRAYAPLSYVLWSALATLALLFCLAAGTALSSISWLRVQGRFEEARQLGQYVLEEVLGRGGMGTVYRAYHALLRRPTAIKVIDPRQINPETAARFEREVRLASMLNNPNTIEIYDFGQTAEHTFYCAMELIDGFTLADLVRIDGPAPVARVIHVLRRVCESLAEAHGLGIIHRDIKPSNIMICQRGGASDVVKVLDFGIAKQVEADDTDDLTQAGSVRGTPGYLAPEQLRSPEHVGPTADIYALGGVAYFLLTGREAFAGRTPLEVLEKVVRDVPPPVADLVPSPIPEPLAALVSACLAKDSSDRPPAISDVQAVLDHLAREVPWDDRAARDWWSQHELSV